MIAILPPLVEQIPVQFGHPENTKTTLRRQNSPRYSAPDWLSREPTNWPWLKRALSNVLQILGLLIQGQAAKPVSIMKALSGTFAFKLALVAAIAVVAVLTFRAFAQPQPAADKKFKFTLKIGKTETEYVDVKNKEDFDKALCALKAKGGYFKVGFKKDPETTPIDPYDPTCSTASINTDKVTTSELAKNAPAGESAANDPHAVYRVQSNSATDIQAVLDTFQ
jgi:hypothetical protein